MGLLRYILPSRDLKNAFCKWPPQPGSNRELFGQQRARGGRSDNLSVKQFMDNAMSLRQQGSADLLPVRGNSSRKGLFYLNDVIENDPIPKRRRGAQSKSVK